MVSSRDHLYIFPESSYLTFLRIIAFVAQAFWKVHARTGVMTFWSVGSAKEVVATVAHAFSVIWLGDVWALINLPFRPFSYTFFDIFSVCMFFWNLDVLTFENGRKEFRLGDFAGHETYLAFLKLWIKFKISVFQPQNFLQIWGEYAWLIAIFLLRSLEFLKSCQKLICRLFLMVLGKIKTYLLLNLSRHLLGLDLPLRLGNCYDSAYAR